MKNRELVRYACSGGLRMYDDDCSIRWHNMPNDERADWLIFFDMCRDDPTAHTEAVINAIQAGVCPRKVTVVRSNNVNFWPYHADEQVQEKVWVFRTGKVFDGIAQTVPDPLNEAPFYLVRPSEIFRVNGTESHLVCFPTTEVPGWLKSRLRRHGHAAHVFRHPAHAWAFLLSFL